MKNPTLLRYSVLALAAMLAVALTSQNGHGTANEVTATGQPLHWPAGAPITYVVNPAGVAGFSTSLQQLVLIGAVDDSFRAWTKIPQASIQFVNGGATTSTGTAMDGVNVISFQDPNFTTLLRPGVLAITSLTFASSSGQTQLGSNMINVQFAGQILDADITFNTGASTGGNAFSPLGTSGATDMIAILMHEVGHLLGLDHTGVVSSIMCPFAEGGTGTGSRTLRSDDTAIAASLYPSANFLSASGAISGTVTNASGGAILSANVVAISSPGGVPQASELTGADGKFTIPGLPAGSYQVLAAPLDGPVTLNNFPGFFSSGQTNFARTLLNSGGTISVVAGQTATANIVVSPASSNPVSIATDSSLLTSQTLGTGQPFPSPAGALFLPRGKTYQILAAGAGLSGGASFHFSAPPADVSPQGGTIQPTSISLPGLTLLAQDLAISSTAALGPSNLSLNNSFSTEDVLGDIVVTVNPSIVAVFNAASSGTPSGKTLAPGTLFSLYGADVAAAADSWLGAPAPTSLGGISVLVGGRYAPLFLTCPGPQSCGQYQQINGMIPFEVAGSSVPITIVAGPNAQGTTVNVPLSPTAPGIFSTDSSGNGQGAVLNGADNTVAAPAGTFPGSHPAKPGDVVVIYATGLGPVTPAPPSGIGSGANGTPIPLLASPLQVTIGQQAVPAANIAFAGLAPGFVGLYQVNVQLSANVPAGNAIPVQITTAQGQTSNAVTFAVAAQ